MGVFDSEAALLKSCEGVFVNNEQNGSSEVGFRSAETFWRLSHCNVTIFFFFNWKEFCCFRRSGYITPHIKPVLGSKNQEVVQKVPPPCQPQLFVLLIADEIHVGHYFDEPVGHACLYRFAFSSKKTAVFSFHLLIVDRLEVFSGYSRFRP